MNTTTSIILGTDDEGNFVSISVFISDLGEVFKSYDLDSDESKNWLSKINILNGKKHYSL